MSLPRTIFCVVAGLAVLGSTCTLPAAAFELSLSIGLQSKSIRFDAPALAPVAYSRFCVQYKDDCEVRRVAFRRPRPQMLNQNRLQDLLTVNREVNRDIAPKADIGSVLDERWRISPSAGACHDYAVTKRHELLERGWPSRSLLLAEVVVPSGEHHLVLVVRTDDGDFVLDNLTAGIRSWSRTPYQWVRIQSPSNPNIWSTIANASA
jgi:predicted transglutaminase-like cysteine proteinase